MGCIYRFCTYTHVDSSIKSKHSTAAFERSFYGLPCIKILLGCPIIENDSRCISISLKYDDLFQLIAWILKLSSERRHSIYKCTKSVTLVSIHTFTPYKVTEWTVNYSTGMVAVVIFQLEVSAELVLYAAEPSFLLSCLSDLLYLLLPLVAPTTFFAPFPLNLWQLY